MKSKEIIKQMGFYYDKEYEIWHNGTLYYHEKEIKNMSAKRFFKLVSEDYYQKGRQSISEEIKQFLCVR